MCANPSTHASTAPYLLDVQIDLLDVLDSQVVVPLRRLLVTNDEPTSNLHRIIYSLQSRECRLKCRIRVVSMILVAIPAAFLCSAKALYGSIATCHWRSA